jgi:hypothetical protein
MSWKFFGGAAILTVGLLLKAGAPLIPVLAGVGVGTFVNWRRIRAAGGKVHKA